ncbi:MAG: selenium metabolism-associated LysR family transcriptional regulator [Nitrospirota bacterium]
MDIHRLRIFTTVFQDKSFSKASKKLLLSQPTISTHIKALEEELNCKLFDRLGRTIIPTKEAEFLFRHAIEVIEKVDALKGAMGQLNKEIAGKLIIGASTIPGTYLLPAMISTFQKKYPSVSFHILVSDSKEIIERVSSHELYLGIVGARLGNEHINYMPFIEDELIVISSPSLVKINLMTLQELIKYPMVLREEGSGTRRETEKILGEKGISLNDIKITGIFGSTDAIKQAVKEGLGVSILSRFSVIDELKHKSIKEIKIADTPMHRRFYIITHKKRSLPSAYNIFLGHVMAESKDL